MSKGATRLLNITEINNEENGNSALLVDIANANTTFTKALTANHAAAAIITPATNKQLVIHDVCSTTAAKDGLIALDFATSGIPIYRYWGTKEGAYACMNMHLPGAVDEPVTLTTTTGANGVFIRVNYQEVTV